MQPSACRRRAQQNLDPILASQNSSLANTVEVLERCSRNK